MAHQLNSKFRFQYATKFICTANIPNTSQKTDALVPGIYQTAVNIHNPHQKKVEIRIKIASPTGISSFKNEILEYDEVQRVTCANLKDFELKPLHGFEGFLVVESTESIDVSAVYTACPKDQMVSSIDVVQIKERVLFSVKQ